MWCKKRVVKNQSVSMNTTFKLSKGKLVSARIGMGIGID